MTTTTERVVVPFGLNHAIPEDVEAAWGARLIVGQRGRVDFIWDRQGCGGDPDARARLLERLNGEYPASAMCDGISYLLRHGRMSTREGRDFTLYDNGLVVMANTLGSHGYCYVAAWEEV